MRTFCSYLPIEIRQMQHIYTNLCLSWLKTLLYV